MQNNISYSGKTDVGLRRGNNEDTYRLVPEKEYFLVADGLGGAAAGELASALFSEAAWEVFGNRDDRSTSRFQLGPCPQPPKTPAGRP